MYPDITHQKFELILQEKLKFFSYVGVAANEWYDVKYFNTFIFSLLQAWWRRIWRIFDSWYDIRWFFLLRMSLKNVSFESWWYLESKIKLEYYIFGES